MSIFRTTEISDAAYESNGLRFITVKSQHLKGRGDICVFVPEQTSHLKNLPLVLLLHGVYGSAWVWTHKGAAHMTTQQLIRMQKIRPMVLAMPSDGLWGDGTAYQLLASGDYEKWIVEDVPAAVKENIACVSDASPLCISGLSMGGFGALRLGAAYPDIFKAISAHSAITAIEQMPLFVEEPLDLYQEAGQQASSVYLSMEANQGKLPPIRFDCGKDDLLIEYNRELHAKLTKSGISHVYEEFEGGHSWSYWKQHLSDTLLFFDHHLND
ncbi:putative tributyrin esterase [Catalinimonas alkaloidigena]|uniref:alpha/beta hydrolase n=1 Tax=Catalinimonas alkaloidigena TaxID=1075417 RepID=UPI002406283B|nr:alpha/beta hydrolase-fold protein [Catalinimonas alkaloidigena]MDF9796454.1 putative tributyrin esterase [Catalinimonas alkaloidigena]